jgi:hypothetical protein
VNFLPKIAIESLYERAGRQGRRSHHRCAKTATGDGKIFVYDIDHAAASAP